MKIAVINSGSSSLKFKLFDMSSKNLLESFTIEHIGEEGALYKNHHEALESIDVDFNSLNAIGHRVVHGGEYFTQSVIIDNDVLEKLESLFSLAPLHNPANVEGIKVAMNKASDVKQIAVFDTAFHATLEEKSYLYALNATMYEKHKIRRYGFHGVSHSYVSKEASKLLGENLNATNLITLHLGNGASICAVKNGKSIDTSMGFTPLEGLVMGTRCGDIDPAIVLYMQRELGMSVDEVDKELNKNSGLYGISGENDVRSICERDDKSAQLALEIMIRRIQKYIGSYIVLLEDVNAIVFTGGIGENSSYIRERVMENKVLKTIKSLVVKTDEELEIANECLKILSNMHDIVEE